MFRSKSSDKSKEARGSLSPSSFTYFLAQLSLFFLPEAKSNGNVFGVALAQCVIDDDLRFQDEANSTSPPAGSTASGTNRKDSMDIMVVTTNDRRTSPSGCVSSTNDSGYSVSPASPSSIHVRRKAL